MMSHSVGALPILCAQCNHQSHASEARFCLLCGGALVQHVVSTLHHKTDMRPWG